MAVIALAAGGLTAANAQTGPDAVRAPTSARAATAAVMLQPSTPAAPTGVTIVENSGELLLEWDEAPGAVEYAIWRDGDWHDYVTAPTTAWTGPIDDARYQIRALLDDDTWTGWSAPVTLAAAGPPATPAGLTISEPAAGQLELAWELSEGAVEYAIWREGTWHDWTTDTSWGGAADDARYQVRALGADGSWSTWTNPVALTTETGPPAIPTGLTATETSTGVQLDWDPSNGAVEYAIWRNGTWYSWVAAPATTWIDTDPTDGAEYQLRALGADGSWSQWTNPVSVGGGAVDNTPPSAVSEPRVIGKRPGDYVEIDWLPATDNVGVDHYRIDYIDADGGDDNFTDTTTEPTYRIDDNDTATPAVAYDHFIITAVDAAGNESEPVELWFTYNRFGMTQSLGYTAERNAASPPADAPAAVPGPADVVDFAFAGENFQSTVVVLKLPRTIPDNFNSVYRLYRDGELLPGAGTWAAFQCAGPNCDFREGVGDLVSCVGVDCVPMLLDRTAVPGETYTYRVVGWDGFTESRNGGVEVTYTVPLD